MNRDEVRTRVLSILKSVAPEADPATLNGQVNLRDQLDVDSMDLLNFAVGLHKEFDVDFPEAVYAKLNTIDGCIDFIASAQGASTMT